MQERGKISSMDLKAYMSNLRKNPKFTKEVLDLVESDLQFGLTIPETEEYTGRKFDYTQMKVYSGCLRNGYSKEVREAIAKEGLTGEQMAVALEFYEKGVPLSTVTEIVEDNGKTAYAMKKLFENVMVKLQEAKAVPEPEETYAKELLEQMKAVIGKIEFQEKRYDALNEKLKELKTAGQDAKIQNNLLEQLAEKDGLLERQQNEINEARVAIARLRNEMDGIKKERDALEVSAENRKKELEVQKAAESPVQKQEQVREANYSQPVTEESNLPYGEQQNSGMEYRMAVVDGKGNLLSLLPVERMESKKRNNTLTSLFSRLCLKRKIDIVKLLAERNLELTQLVQIKKAIEQGLNDKQLLVLINSGIPAGQMEEIIGIAVFENSQKREE